MSHDVSYDPTTGEILAAPPPNPYAVRTLNAIIATLDHGEYAALLEDALKEITEALRSAQMKEKGASATLTLKFNFITKPDTELFGITGEHSLRLPKKPIAKSALYMDEAGNFSLLHPKQAGLPFGPRPVGGNTEIRAAAPAATEIRSAGDAPSEIRSA